MRRLDSAQHAFDDEFFGTKSDLAVDLKYQRHGIGKELIRRTQAELGPETSLILLSAPAAIDYYPKLGFVRHESAWVLARDRKLNT